MKKLILIVVASLLFLTGCNTSASVIDSEKMDEVVNAIKEAYGDDYGPEVEIEAEMIKDVYQIDTDNLEYFIVEGPMMSLSTDMMFALLAKDGKVDDVVADVEAYQDYLINESFQYPMNMARVKASQIVVKGNAVFFLVLGAFDERTEVSEEEALEFAQEQVSIGVDAIESLLG